MKTYLTGMTPTGSPHIGNYFGMMQQTIALQDEDANRYFFISDQHTFTSKKDPEEFRKNQREVMIDWLALGIDPDKTVFFAQSDVRAHTELTWYLSCLTPMGLLERAHAFKDKTGKGLEANVGLFTYPVLMTADILLYDVNTVPVGKDQKQHVEMARDIAQKFNHHYGETFVLPEAQILEEVQTIPGLDGAKMSKSYGNTINIFEDEASLKSKVMSIKTDTVNLGDPIDPDCTVMQFHQLFSNPDYDKLVDQCKNGDIGFGALKEQLVDVIWEYFSDARERREKLASDEGYLRECMMKGAVKANEKAEEVLGRARDRMGLGRHISPLPILSEMKTESEAETEKSDGPPAPISFSPELREQFPNHIAGVIEIPAYTYTGDFEDKISELYQQARDQFGDKKESEIPAISAWRNVFSELGLKPTKYRCAAESLLRRFNKEDDLPRIHPLVDLCNAYSLSTACPIAVYDLDKVSGHIRVRKSGGSENYQTFGEENEHPEEGEVAFIDEMGNAHSRRWCHRQSGLSAMSSDTKNVLIVIESHALTGKSDVDSAVNGLEQQLKSAGIPAFNTWRIYN